MKIFSGKILSNLIEEASGLNRRRKNLNIHESYSAPCQKLFNAIHPGSYIQPHRHTREQGDEFIIAVKGRFYCLLFNDIGGVDVVCVIGSEMFGDAIALAVEIPPMTWHTIVAIEPNSMILEVKLGPFNQDGSKEMAPWAPCESDKMAGKYLLDITKIAESVKVSGTH